MGFNNGIERVNRQVANVGTMRGSNIDLGSYVYQPDYMTNFVISGGTDPYVRVEPLYNLLEGSIGRYPVIVLHNRNSVLESTCYNIWNQLYQGVTEQQKAPFWMLNQDNRDFEPFYGMPEMQISSSIRQLARKIDFTPTPKLDRVTRAHIRVLNELDIPVSLSGFYYLCQFHDMGEFHDNILALPCGEIQGKMIWADMGADSDDGNSQFDLFRTVINNLAAEALQSAWNCDNSVAEITLQNAFNENGTLLLSINDLYSDLLFSYILEELKNSIGRPYFLIIDNLRITDERFLDFLKQPNPDCSLGLIGENVVEMVGREENSFQRIAEKINLFIIYKHGTGKTAEKLSELLGKYERTKVEESTGTMRGFFSILPKDRHSDVRYSTENTYRVMPEEILGLGVGQAIIFDTTSDTIIRYN